MDQAWVLFHRFYWHILLTLCVLAIFVTVLAAQATECPQGVAKCKVITLSPEEEQRYIAPPIQGFDKLGPRARLEATARRDALQKSLLQDRERAIAEKIARAREDFEMRNREARSAHEAEQARLDQRDQEYRLANQSFREAHPNLTLALPAAGAAAAGLIPYGGRMVARGLNNQVADQLTASVARARAALGADAATRAAARGEMKAGLGPGGIGRMRDEGLTTSGIAGGLGVGALGSAEASLIPYEIDMALPQGSHGRQEAEDPGNWLQRGGFGSLGGVLGSSYGLKAPLLQPRVVPPVSEMEGLLAGLKTAARPKAPAPDVKAATATKAPPRRRRKPPESEDVAEPPLHAAGGSVAPPFYARQGASALGRAGYIHGPTAGRADRVPMKVGGNSYVMPADVVSGIGGGNSTAGAAALNKLFKVGPYGTPGSHLTAKAIRQKFADGGMAPGVEIAASDGEFVVPPDAVLQVGGGDMKRGHDILDHMVHSVRRKTIKTLRRLPGPKDS
jgi:hypothetical protein